MQRSIVFATWAAEEFGIIGSTEWCEQHADEISSSCVAYVNLDMAAMGTNFGAKASPLLSAAVLAAAGAVPQARAVAGEGGALPSALDAWKARTDDGVARVGLIDGGSDHEAFQFHLGVPSCQLGAGGSAGTSYHSNYDTIAWYRKVVGEDYEPALMVTRVCVDLVRRLADDPSPPLDPRALAPMIREALSAIDSPSPPSPASAGGGSPPRPAILPALEASIASLERAASAFADAAERADKDGAPRRTMATTVAQLERTWLSRSPGAPWRRHELIGTDPDAGYSPQALPLLRAALRSGDAAAISSAVEELRTSIDTVTHQLTHATTAPDNQ
ncbi:MAG: M28 family peptidase [Phycisphaerales bacterium]